MNTIGLSRNTITIFWSCNNKVNIAPMTLNGIVTQIKSFKITLKVRVISTVKYKVANIIIIPGRKSYISKVVTAVPRLLHNQSRPAPAP